MYDAFMYFDNAGDDGMKAEIVDSGTSNNRGVAQAGFDRSGSNVIFADVASATFGSWNFPAASFLVYAEAIVTFRGTIEISNATNSLDLQVAQNTAAGGSSLSITQPSFFTMRRIS